MKATLFLGAWMVMWLGGCGDVGGSASCKEACEEDDDCQSGLSCFHVTEGQRCLPSECDTCFDQGKTCSLDELQEGSDPLTCELRECL